MDNFDALQMVLDLARQNLADEKDMPDEYARQILAIEMIELLANRCDHDR